ncbi:MAG: DUF3857 and transglutaminase domain-containing protein [Pyrinomonadaceae bacterium]
MLSLKSGNLILVVLLCLLFAASQTVLARDDWRPVSPQELSMTEGKIEKDADAEAIFWEVRVNDSTQNLIMEHYVRIKIFTENGREKFSKVDIPFVKGLKIKDIEARVIKPDGSIVELNKDDVFEKEIVKTDQVKVKAKSFAVPNIEAGVVLEYRYKEVYRRGNADNMPMIFQRDIPMQNATYYFKPALNVKYLTFNLDDNKFVKDKGGYYRVTMENVPALKSEPNMPPENEVRSWLLLYYVSDRMLRNTTTDFWSYAGGDLAEYFEIKDTLKPGKKMKAAADEITAGAASDMDKLKKLFEFCRTKVKNIEYDSTLTDDDREKIKSNGSDDDTYKKLQGRPYEINKLFASLADAAGFDTRIAFTGDRSKLFFNPNRAHTSFIHLAGVAVKIGGEWQYFDPGTPYLPFGKLEWFEESTSVFLLAYKDYVTTETPISEASESLAKRTGRFKLLEDGTLEGTVKVEYSGHLASQYKAVNYDETPAKREEFLKDAVKERMSTAELSEIAVKNVEDWQMPFAYEYKVKIPNYAQKTGKRLFLQPGYFEHGIDPRFSSATRKYSIYFRFPWSEKDDITIDLPAGYELDNADAPEDVQDPSRIGSLKTVIKIDKGKNQLIYERDFLFGGGGNILFNKSNYEPIKNMFDAFHRANNHMITLVKND